jgi:non-heme chloroperoxidase
MPLATVGLNALDRHSSEKQGAAMPAGGHRVITYYPRGFGASSPPSVGYEFVTLATDLHVLLSRLRLRGWYWRGPVR